MRYYWVGFDVGKAFHPTVCLKEGEVVLSRKVEATGRDLEACREELAASGDPSERWIGVDLVGGPATLLQAVLLGGGERLFHISGMAVNRARDGSEASGENKSDAKDARVIANQLRMHWTSLQELHPRNEASAELRALVSHRRSLVEDQARLITRLRALLLEVFPGLEAALDGPSAGQYPLGDAPGRRTIPGAGPRSDLTTPSGCIGAKTYGKLQAFLRRYPQPATLWRWRSSRIPRMPSWRCKSSAAIA